MKKNPLILSMLLIVFLTPWLINTQLLTVTKHRTTAIVDRDQDHSPQHQRIALIKVIGAASGLMTSTVNPDHHRMFLGAIKVCRPDIKVETVLALDSLG